MKHKVAVFRKEHFNAAHRLNVPAWDTATNQKVFGKCNYENYHGHNYDLIVKVTGFPDPQSGYLIDMKILSAIIQAKVIEPFDHRNLNLDVPYFKDINPTAEHIAMVIFELIRPEIPENLELQIRLYETERNFVEYPAG